MIINRITIELLDDIDYFDTSFDSQLVILSGHEAETVLKAIGMILKWSKLTEVMPKARICDGTMIKAEISEGRNTFCISVKGIPSKNELQYTVRAKGENISGRDFYSTIHQSAEEDRLSCFSIK